MEDTMSKIIEYDIDYPERFEMRFLYFGPEFVFVPCHIVEISQMYYPYSRGRCDKDLAFHIVKSQRFCLLCRQKNS